MSADPWSRPTVEDVRRILADLESHEELFDNERTCERLNLTIPAEIIGSRGNTIPAMTREISRNGIGLLHRGALTPGMYRVKLASELRVFEYSVQVEWCIPCAFGMFISGGPFVRNAQLAE